MCLHNKPFSLTIGRGGAFTTYPSDHQENEGVDTQAVCTLGGPDIETTASLRGMIVHYSLPSSDEIQ